MERASHRAADLLPEEVAAGSADPQAQAEEILLESDEREAAVSPDEQRTSDESADDGTR